MILLLSLFYIALWAACAAIVIVMAAAAYFLIIKPGLLVKISTAGGRARTAPDVLPELLERVNVLEQENAALEQELVNLRDAWSLELQELVEVLANHELEHSAWKNGQETRHLAEIYARTEMSIAVFLKPVRELRGIVAALEQCAEDPGIAAVLDEYKSLSQLDEPLRQRRNQLLESLDSEKIQELQAGFRQGRIPRQEYLRTVYAGMARLADMPSAAEEHERMAQLAGSIEERFLNWIDSITELRDMALARGRQEMYQACSHVIERAGEVMEEWDIRLIDVPVGSTRFDDRLHDLYGTVPRPDLVPETVIGVRKLGQRRKGVLVRKPQVLVASAAG